MCVITIILMPRNCFSPILASICDVSEYVDSQATEARMNQLFLPLIFHCNLLVYHKG